MGVYICLMSLSGVIYTLIGVMLALRANYEPMCRRSPWLVFISHFANLVEVEFFLLTKYLYDYDEDTKRSYLSLYQAVMLVSHYLFYFPYVLRCYRLYFVFKLGFHWNDSDSYFYLHRSRATQTWLIKVLFTLMVPVLTFAICLVFVPQLSQIYPTTYTADSSNSLARMESAVIFLFFLEELFFICAVWHLRDVNDDFAMTSELVWVCLLWMTNSFLLTSLFPLAYWMYASILRNFLIMLVSSFWPLYKSFGKPHIEVPLTLEALRSLTLIMHNEQTLEAFSRYLKTGKFEYELSKLSMDTSFSTDKEGYWLLEFWLECEVFKFNATEEKAQMIIENYLARELLNLPRHISRAITEASQLAEVGLFSEAQEYAFKVLSEHYFPLFQRSTGYSDLLKDVVRQDIRISRLATTSFIGKSKD
jgi:hypothetical protein